MNFVLLNATGMLYNTTLPAAYLTVIAPQMHVRCSSTASNGKALDCDMPRDVSMLVLLEIAYLIVLMRRVMGGCIGAENKVLEKADDEDERKLILQAVNC